MFPSRKVSVDITVHQQPHDTVDAARLYGELRDKAEREVTGAMLRRIGAHNEVCVAIVSGVYRPQVDRHDVTVVFAVNGVRQTIHCADLDAADDEVMMTLAYRIAAEAMAKLSTSGVLPARLRDKFKAP